MTETAPTSSRRGGKMPPFLLLAALVFWGWQTDFLFVGAILGIALETARFTRWRWNLDDTDFNRIWSFCVVLTVALAGYTFTANAGGGFSGILGGTPVPNGGHPAVLTAARFLRWLPMTTFGFVAAQVFNERPFVPLTAVSIVLRWRRRRGDETFAGHYLDISFPYFMLCLFSAGIHSNLRTQTLFWGESALVAWALWSIRSRRFGGSVWLAALAAVIGLGFLGEFGINQTEQAIQNFNAQWISRFFGQGTDPLQSLTSMGRIGKLKLSARIVVWLEPASVGNAPEYLREASYRIYGPNQTWYAGGPRNSFEGLTPEADNTSWVLVPGKRGAASVNIACYLEGRSREGDPQGVLPLPSGCCRLDNLPVGSSVIELQKNPTGAVLATGSALMIFDARYGLGATLDSPPDASTNRLDLAVPRDEAPALKQVVAELHLANADDAQKLRAVKKFFLDKFTYSIWQGADKLATANATPLTRFLLTSRTGHCEYFATATVLLLRQLGIPARYAVGYYVHETRGSGFVVRERDAHAWCLAWNRATRTWEDFDTTPPSWVAIETGRSTGLEWLVDLRSWIVFQFEKFRWRQAHLQQYIFGALAPVMVVLLCYILFRRRRKQNDRAKIPKPPAEISRPGLDSEFYQLERELAARGVARQPDEPLSEWLARLLADPALAGWRARLPALLRLHYGHRFDPRGLSDPQRETLAREVNLCLEELSRTRRRPAQSA